MNAGFVNDPGALVPEALAGLVAAHPGLLRLNADPAFVARAQAPSRPKVALLSGGGSGHEPLHAGFVGAGMLDAAVPGAVFSSPTAIQVKAAAEAVECGAGVLMIVKNYTGDVLNFGTAAEVLRGAGMAVETVLVDDDLATSGPDEDAGEGGPGRRGTAAVVTVEKICGAASEAGASLAELAALGSRVVASARTMAVALAPCTHPGNGEPSFELAPGEVELGVGIHGERGVAIRPYAPARELVAELTAPLVADLGLEGGDSVIAIVNGLGGTSALELSLVFHALDEFLATAGIEIARPLLGSYVTALDMRGCSITIVEAAPDLLSLWDAPVRTPGLRW